MTDAPNRPLGNYFRVRHLHLTHMHAALREVGVLLAAARVHAGWEDVDADGNIPLRPDILGGHAFAIVGYDRLGLWIQNSWGKGWGLKGFAHMAYEDWLENGWDCWVARLGVPTHTTVHAAAGVAGRAAAFGYIPDEAVVLNEIRPHFVNLGNEGALSGRGRYATTHEDLDTIFDQFVPAVAKERKWKTPRFLIYAHGGLNSEAASGQRVASFRPILLDNNIYPIHFMWETGLLETVRHILEDGFRTRRFTGWGDALKERFRDLLDEGLELATRPLGRPLWREMQENAAGASSEEGGARLFAQRLAKYVEEKPAEVHLVGHSAGSILLAHLVPLLRELGVPVNSLTLFAPACTVELFEKTVVPVIGNGVEAVALFNLSDEAERADTVGPYGKSLLYLVSEAFEGKKATPILGMESFRETEPRIKEWFGKPVFDEAHAVAYASGFAKPPDLASDSRTHGGFDNDEDTLNAMLRIVTGRKSPEAPFQKPAGRVFGESSRK